MTFKSNDRVVLQSQLSTHVGQFGAGTVCTVISEPKGQEQDEILILKCGYESNSKRPILVGAPSCMLRKADEEDLKHIDYKTLVDEVCWIGKKFSVGHATKFGDVEPGEVGTVEDIKLAPNALKDLITFSFGEKGNHKFERTFVDIYMNPYDEEVEKMYGEELVLKDMPRNYLLPGARVYFNRSDTSEIVIIQSIKEDLAEVETMYHEELAVKKEKLVPILNAEDFLTCEEETIIPLYFRDGGQFKAKENIAKHAFLKNFIKENDIVEITYNNGININAYEDSYRVMINDNPKHSTNVSYLDLKKFFEPYGWREVEPEIDEDEGFDLSEFAKKDYEDELEDQSRIHCEEIPADINIEAEEVPAEIMDVNILGFRFKFDEETRKKFTIDAGKTQYEIDEIDMLITALEKLKELKNIY